MSARVPPEERFIYWMLPLIAGFVVLMKVFGHWMPSYLASGLAGVVFGLAASLLPGARKFGLGKRLLYALGTGLVAMLGSATVEILFDLA